jgi:alpha-2-macroglobulin
MKFTLVILFWLLAGISRSADTENGESNAGGVVVEPGSGEIQPGIILTFTFPAAMIGPASIDVPNQPFPFTTQPELEGEFLWRSQTEGAFTVKRVKPGATYSFRLLPGLRDFAGQPVPSKDWSAEFTTAQFAVTADFENQLALGSQPQLFLESTYKVRLTDVAEHTWLQDRDSRQRYPVDVVQSGEAFPEATEFRVVPRSHLPVGRTYDLIVDGLLDAASHEPLSYPRVFPAGTTAPLQIEWIGAFNHPLEEPQIKVKFNDEIDPGEATAERFHVEPAVQNLEIFADGQVVSLKGDFILTQHYRVTVSPDVKGARGYGLTAESKWGATFHSKEPCIIFPSSELFLRALKELRFSFLQINTGPVEWKLARIPPEKLGPVRARLTEYEQQQLDPLTGKTKIDPRTGFALMRTTDLLVESFGLPVVSRGNLEASREDEETLREINCESRDGKPFSGAYLLEASATLPDKRIVGNRSIVFASNSILSQKRSPTAVFVRIAGMTDAQPLGGVTIHALTDENIELERAATDQNGITMFSRAALFPGKQPHATLFVADTVDGPVIRPIGIDAGYTSGAESVALPQKHRAAIVPDRNLYRPGQTVVIKGILRDANENRLSMPAPGEVTWQVTEGDEKRVVKQGTATLSRFGAWEASWQIPGKTKTGRYQIRCGKKNDEYAGTAEVDIEEYRVPLFSIIVQAENEVGPVAHARISSAYFHGAPNAGAHVHWKATWTVSTETHNENLKCYNSYTQIGPSLDLESVLTRTVEGDAKLDRQGMASLECESPFKDNPAVGLCDVSWRADVTSIDGQTLAGGAPATISSAPTRLAVQATEDLKSPKTVQARVQAFDQNYQTVTNVALHSDLFLVVTKTVKEQVAPFVYRYRNTDQFSKVGSQELKGPATLRFEVKQTGRYVVSVSAPGIQTPLVSDETTVTGEEPAELPVENETSFQIDQRPEPLVPGETATLTTKAPFPGVAWVSIETDKLLDTLLVQIPGNAGRIEIPIKKEYAPNAFVSVYLTRPGGDKALPLERFAYTEIAVQRPDWKLKIEPEVPAHTVRPGEMIHGRVRVTSEGKPVPDADVAVFVVDDAVLQLGGWQLPDLVSLFYYQRAFGIRSYESLNSYQETIQQRNLTLKGFVVGDGGEEKIGNIVNARKEFRTLAFSATALNTDSEGNASFDFTAPDNLTTYRVVAFGDTSDSRFGGDAGATVKVSKPVLVEAALPRFLRDGDEIELRAVVHQSFTNSDQLRVHCSTDANCALSGDTDLTNRVDRDIPAVFRFKAKVTDHDLRPAKIRFDVAAQTEPGMTDSIEISVPVGAPAAQRLESVAATLRGSQYDLQTVIPEAWKHGRGMADVIVSTSPWLPQIAGIPMLLEYPHGCFEQISSRLLGYAMLGNLLAYLPDAETRDQEYRTVIAHGLKQVEDSILDNGMLPYWPGDTVGNAFVTAQALWAANEAIDAGFEVSEGVPDRLRGALKEIVQGRLSASRFDQVFALFALSQTASTGSDLAPAAEELYLRRNETGDEGRALLALALHQLAILPKEQPQLLREIDAPVKARAFNPLTFESTTRAEAICALALSTIAPKTWTTDKQRRVRDRLNALMSSSASLSTQENLWLLLAFKSMLGAQESAPLKISDTNVVLSKNGRSAAWLNCPLPNIDLPRTISFGTASPETQTPNSELRTPNSEPGSLTCLMRAKYAPESPETDRVDRGLRIERVVRDLNDPKRTGNEDAPFRLGDQILVTYRINTQKTQNYVALEDLLPAGLETVNPALALIAKFLDIPEGNAGANELPLSHSELRDQSTLLYFNELSSGPGQYSVLARATAVGRFRWPATQVLPMYDSRFSGLTPSSVCVVSE